MSDNRTGILRPVVTFALSGLAVLVLVAVAGAYALRSLSTSEALRDARRITTVTGRGIVEPALTTAVVRGDPRAITRLDRIVRQRVLAPDVARIKIWNAEGKILYSDEPLLMGRRFPLGPDELRALRSETTSAEVANLSSPENTYERNLGHLTSVYLGLRAQDGTPVLYEEYLRSSAIAGDSRSVARLFAPVGIVALLVLAVLQVPLAWRMARRIRSAQRDRELFLQRAIDASDHERRVIASGLHDGVVQELAGHSFQMAAALEQHRQEPELRRALDEGAAGTRNAIRQLRSLLLEIYPPALRDQGLSAALPDLASTLTGRGVDVSIDVQDGLALSGDVERLVFRTAQEALRNTAAHAAAEHVGVDVRQANGTVTLQVVDDGCGFDAAQLADRRAEGHFGLSMLRDLCRSAGAELRVSSQPGAGTTVELEVPLR
ncbi:MAG: two-component system, NarL family, sensor kinase [Gaiellales bacterium]|jgi:signal transduction histidine kinase|nr:two-component system, NarL family, sensor kinase [Gaiellales bacterium]